jgi:hypothetical protein
MPAWLVVAPFEVLDAKLARGESGVLEKWNSRDGRRWNGGWWLAARAGCWLTLAVQIKRVRMLERFKHSDPLDP